MALPTFEKQPNEKINLQPKIIDILRSEGFIAYEIDRLFDLFVSNQEGIDSYLELKVRLASQNHSIPISRLQWQCINNHIDVCKFESSYGVLIYDYRNGGMYALAKASELKAGITKRQPSSTSYISAQVLNGINWVTSTEAKIIQISWLKR